jgi:hypothetical protein
MTIESRGVKADGQPVTETATFRRTGGRQGLAGTWQNESANLQEWVMELASDGADGIAMRYPDMDLICKARFDERDYPAVGPKVPVGTTMSFRRNGDGSFEMVQKVDGQVHMSGTFRVSTDGRTLTHTGKIGADSASAQSFTVVYDRP